MARRGRLSKGCQTCRKRKIKCDQLLPGCTQCRKSGWVCPQYGDTVDRMMQYQEPPTFITRPARKACAQLKAVKQATKLGILSDLVVPAMLCKSLPREITQSLNDRAISYFIHTHAFRDNGQVRGCYEYLLTLDIFVMEEPYTCLSAAALAAYGNACRRPDILREARRYYGRSLQLINSALQSRAKAAEISTMISILLLNSFEALTSDTMQTMGHSDGHMRGVLTIMSLRGPGLMESREGLQVPAEMIDLRKHAAKFLDIRNPAWVLEELMLKVATFRADVEAGVYDGQMTAIDHALELDNELYRLTGKMPAHWHFDAVIAHDSSRAPSGYYHVYPDFWVAYIWNYARRARICDLSHSKHLNN
ncbi:hypothetical protein BJX63DRAFT_434580 [Aspergillus granulosus]|uniref:Zn(2)-C6 fungal-type domain-containing protein n=1 Tax=Aspergillus granulosus TaxID=176169 RepID=A0ABR4H5G1_9EURO